METWEISLTLISRIELSFLSILNGLTSDLDSIILLILVTYEFLYPGVGPYKVIEAMFNAQAIWVGPVSDPMTRSTCEINDISESIESFSHILTLGAWAFIFSAITFSFEFPQIIRKLASIKVVKLAKLAAG